VVKPSRGRARTVAAPGSTCWRRGVFENHEGRADIVEGLARQTPELTSPSRVACVAEGLRRLGCPPVQRKYFVLHAQLDVEHTRAWNAEALVPLVSWFPECAPLIAEVALMRLICGEQCFDAHRANLWADDRPVRYAAE